MANLPPAPENDFTMNRNNTIIAFEMFSTGLAMAVNNQGVTDPDMLAEVLIMAHNNVRNSSVLRAGHEEMLRQMLEHKKRARKEVIPVVYFVVPRGEGGILKLHQTAVNYFLWSNVQENMPRVRELIGDNRDMWLGCTRMDDGMTFFSLYDK